MKLELIDEDERFRASLPFEHCYDEVKDVIKEACQFQLDADRLIENEYKARIAELEAENKELKENIPTKEEANHIYQLLPEYTKCKLCISVKPKLRRIAGK